MRPPVSRCFEYSCSLCCVAVVYAFELVCQRPARTESTASFCPLHGPHHLLPFFFVDVRWEFVLDIGRLKKR